jgi:hypothetical protein
MVRADIPNAPGNPDRVSIERKADLDHIAFPKKSWLIGSGQATRDTQIDDPARHPFLGDHVVESHIAFAGVPPTPALLPTRCGDSSIHPSLIDPSAQASGRLIPVLCPTKRAEKAKKAGGRSLGSQPDGMPTAYTLLSDFLPSFWIRLLGEALRAAQRSANLTRTAPACGLKEYESVTVGRDRRSSRRGPEFGSRGR